MDTVKQTLPILTADGLAETLPLFGYSVVLIIIQNVISGSLLADTACPVCLTPVWATMCGA